MSKKKILVTGGNGRFAKILKKNNRVLNLYFADKIECNILKFNSIIEIIKKVKPKVILHTAGLSRPMSMHEQNISKSIDLNIIGTANVTKVCSKKNIKLIYFSTNYVYPGIKGNYSESDPLLPVNNYAWSKLGGEASAQLYKNSLILRICMTEKPFVHKKAFANVKNSFLYHDDVAKILFKLLNKKGIINIGGKTKYIYDFAKKDNPYVKKIFLKKNMNLGMPFNASLNIKKLKKIINSK